MKNPSSSDKTAAEDDEDAQQPATAANAAADATTEPPRHLWSRPARTVGSAAAARRVHERASAHRREQQRLNDHVDLIIAQRRAFEAQGAKASRKLRHVIMLHRAPVASVRHRPKPTLLTLPDLAFGEMVID